MQTHSLNKQRSRLIAYGLGLGLSMLTLNSIAQTYTGACNPISPVYSNAQPTGSSTYSMTASSGTVTGYTAATSHYSLITKQTITTPAVTLTWANCTTTATSFSNITPSAITCPLASCTTTAGCVATATYTSGNPNLSTVSMPASPGIATSPSGTYTWVNCTTPTTGSSIAGTTVTCPSSSCNNPSPQTGVSYP